MNCEKGTFVMTTFSKEHFSYSGGFLMYTGDYSGRPVWEDRAGIHPTRVGTPKDLFIARFKYRGPITKAIFMKELLKNHTVESYAAALDSGKSPLDVLRQKNPSWYENTMDKFRLKAAA
jgi:hypothetical protein